MYRDKRAQDIRGLNDPLHPLREPLPSPHSECILCGPDGLYQTLRQIVMCNPRHLADLVLVNEFDCKDEPREFLSVHRVPEFLSGRGLLIAFGVKAARPRSKVILLGRSADLWRWGTTPSRVRRAPLTCVLLDRPPGPPHNASADPSSPDPGNAQDRIPCALPDPVETSIHLGATFVAQGTPGDQKSTADLIEKAIRHNGLAVVHVTVPPFADRQAGSEAENVGIVYEQEQDRLEGERRNRKEEEIPDHADRREILDAFKP